MKRNLGLFAAVGAFLGAAILIKFPGIPRSAHFTTRSGARRCLQMQRNRTGARLNPARHPYSAETHPGIS